MHRNLRTIRPNIFFDTPILRNCIPEGYRYTTERKKYEGQLHEVPADKLKEQYNGPHYRSLNH